MARNFLSQVRHPLWLPALLLAACCGAPLPAAAHPMGNFSLNHFTGLEVHPASVRLTYIIDMAEIPTFQELQEHGLVAKPEDPRALAYRDRKVREFQAGLFLEVGGKQPPLRLRSADILFPGGAGGLPTLRLTAVFDAPLEVTTGRLVYEDRNYRQRIGWKEIVATAQGGAVLTQTSVPAVSASAQLTNYAADLLQSPPQDLRAEATFTVPAAARAAVRVQAPASVDAAHPPSTAPAPRNPLAELMTTERLGLGAIALSLLVAMSLGAFHALEPGHGKTLVAAYLVGSRGTAWHAVLLGLTVTASHTAGVYALGGVALFASHYVMPEQLYPWLGLFSGLLIAGVGVVLLRQAWRRVNGHAGGYHHHGHGHAHELHPHPHHHDHHHGHDHAHESHPHAHDRPQSVSYGSLLTLGITGGMIPCPAALVVLLSAVALQRIAFGFLLIVAFSLGLALVLVGMGVLLVSARGLVQRWGGEGPWAHYLPLLSPLVITPIGVVIAVRSLAGMGLFPGF